MARTVFLSVSTTLVAIAVVESDLFALVANAVIMSGGLAFVANGSSTHEVRACLSNALPAYDFRVRCCLVSLRR